MELETASSFFPSLQIYKGTSPVCTGSWGIGGFPVTSRLPAASQMACDHFLF